MAIGAVVEGTRVLPVVNGVRPRGVVERRTVPSGRVVRRALPLQSVRREQAVDGGGDDPCAGGLDGRRRPQTHDGRRPGYGDVFRPIPVGAVVGVQR